MYPNILDIFVFTSNKIGHAGHSRFSLKIELEQSVGDLKSTLAREDIHAVTSNCHGKITARWWAISLLFNLFPLSNLTLPEHTFYI